MWCLSPEFVLRDLYAAYANGDLEGALDYCTDDVIFALNLPVDIIPFGGEAHGKNEFRRILGRIGRDFDLISYEPSTITITGYTGRAQVVFSFHHRASGLELEGVMRHEVVFESGRVCCIREYHDTERVRAFMQLANAPERVA